MNAVDRTMAGAASGETIKFLTAPKDSHSQAKGPKSNEYHFCYSGAFLEVLSESPLRFFIRRTTRR